MRLGQAQHINTWIRHLILFHREKVFRKLVPVMLVISLYAFTIVMLDNYWAFFDRINNPNLGQFHLVFSFILAIVISFRVNTTYARWWEGRNLWGAIVNNSRNLGMKFEHFAGLEKHHEFYDYLRIFPQVLKLYLRKDVLGVAKQFQSVEIVWKKEDGHPVVFLINKMYRTINDLRRFGDISMEQYMVMDVHLVNLTDMMGGCERITNTPIPSAFSFFVKQGLLFYSLIFPFGWADKFGYLIIPMMLVMLYILLGLEIMSEELEDPFGTDDNDLPLDMIANNIASNVKSIAENR